jgi:hypothetical protein
MDVAHVIDWSSATVQWKSAGFELIVRLTPGATERQAAMIADALRAQFAISHPAARLTVASDEPKDGKPAELTLTSPSLLSINPRKLRDIANGVADSTTDHVATAETRDAAMIEHWLRALSES